MTDELDRLEVTIEGLAVGALYLRAQRPSDPWWLEFLRSGTANLPKLLNQSTAAVLFVPAEGRLIAVTFGYGRNLLAPGSFERDFGLRVALNVVDDKTLKSVDARAFEELTLTTRSQTSRGAAFESFRLNELRDLLRAVTGTPKSPEVGHRVTGADALKLTYDADLKTLPAKCTDLVGWYGAQDYKQRFGFIDHIRELRDPEQIRKNDSALLARLSERDFDRLHLAPPEVTDWAEIDRFRFSSAKDVEMDDLDVVVFLDGLGKSPTLDEIKRERVAVIYGSGGEPHEKWKLYDCIVCEIVDGDHLYILCEGRWYEVEGRFAQQVSDEVATLWKGRRGSLPDAAKDEHEGAYNARAASASGAYLLDELIIKPERYLSGIEFCDLLTPDRRMIHVKRKTRSSTLSHLFAQGVVAAETFLHDRSFRDELRGQAEEKRSVPVGLIPHDRPDPTAWEVAFAIIGPGSVTEMPFFSQLNFRNSADRLQRLGFTVTISGIPLSPGLVTSPPTPSQKKVPDEPRPVRRHRAGYRLAPRW